jgi:hypothetical protein
MPHIPVQPAPRGINDMMQCDHQPYGPAPSPEVPRRDRIGTDRLGTLPIGGLPRHRLRTARVAWILDNMQKGDRPGHDPRIFRADARGLRPSDWKPRSDGVVRRTRRLPWGLTTGFGRVLSLQP